MLALLPRPLSTMIKGTAPESSVDVDGNDSNKAAGSTKENATLLVKTSERLEPLAWLFQSVCVAICGNYRKNTSRFC